MRLSKQNSKTHSHLFQMSTVTDKNQSIYYNIIYTIYNIYKSNFPTITIIILHKTSSISIHIKISNKNIFKKYHVIKTTALISNINISFKYLKIYIKEMNEWYAK